MTRWFRAEFRDPKGYPDSRGVALVRRTSGSGPWDDQGCAYMLTHDDAVALIADLQAAVLAWDDALTPPAAPPPTEEKKP
jgi:hypothetical protein